MRLRSIVVFILLTVLEGSLLACSFSALPPFTSEATQELPGEGAVFEHKGGQTEYPELFALKYF